MERHCVSKVEEWVENSRLQTPTNGCDNGQDQMTIDPDGDYGRIGFKRDDPDGTIISIF